MENVSVIIVAGGSGSRMGADIPKQFLKLNGTPILAITLRRFLDALPGCRITVVLPEGEIPRWEAICAEEGLEGTHMVCAGGNTRFASVLNGLDTAGDCDYIAVHDGVRPLVSPDMIRRCISTAATYGTAIPAVRPVDSFRRLTEDDGGSHPIDRERLRAIQTPQVFRADLLLKAYSQPYRHEFTDDASVVEAYGTRITLCEGERSNIKITTPEDLCIAEALLSRSECQ